MHVRARANNIDSIADLKAIYVSYLNRIIKQILPIYKYFWNITYFEKCRNNILLGAAKHEGALEE